MGSSLTISHVIILISSVVLASGVSGCIIYNGNQLQNNIVQTVSDARETMSLQVEIVYATFNESTTPHSFVIFAKNVGRRSMVDFTNLDVYVGEYGKATFYPYKADAEEGSGFFSLEEVDGDDDWESGETAILRAYSTDDPSGTVFEVKIVPFRGIGTSYMFTPPP